MAQVFALEIDLCPAEMVREAFGEIKWRGPADELPEIVVEFLLKRFVLLCGKVGGFKLRQRGHERLRGEFTAVESVMPCFIRHRHGRETLRTVEMNFLTSARSLIPG